MGSRVHTQRGLVLKETLEHRAREAEQSFVLSACRWRGLDWQADWHAGGELPVLSAEKIAEPLWQAGATQSCEPHSNQLLRAQMLRDRITILTPQSFWKSTAKYKTRNTISLNKVFVSSSVKQCAAAAADNDTKRKADEMTCNDVCVRLLISRSCWHDSLRRVSVSTSCRAPTPPPRSAFRGVFHQVASIVTLHSHTIWWHRTCQSRALPLNHRQLCGRAGVQTSLHTPSPTALSKQQSLWKPGESAECAASRERSKPF